MICQRKERLVGLFKQRMLLQTPPVHSCHPCAKHNQKSLTFTSRFVIFQKFRQTKHLLLEESFKMKYCGFACVLLVLSVGLATGAPQGNPDEKPSPMPVRISNVFFNGCVQRSSSFLMACLRASSFLALLSSV